MPKRNNKNWPKLKVEKQPNKTWIKRVRVRRDQGYENLAPFGLSHSSFSLVLSALSPELFSALTFSVSTLAWNHGWKRKEALSLYPSLLVVPPPSFFTFPIDFHRATSTTIFASSLENQQHHAVDQPMPDPTAVLTSPTRHLGGGAWVHVPPFMVGFAVFKPAEYKSVGFEVRRRRRRSETTFVGGAWRSRATLPRGSDGYVQFPFLNFPTLFFIMLFIYFLGWWWRGFEPERLWPMPLGDKGRGVAGWGSVLRSEIGLG